MVSRPIKHLLSGLIDYAGLFPPAHLPMPAAVAEFAHQRAGDHAWVLNTFVVPTGRLDAFADALDTHHGGDGMWSLSALVKGDPLEERSRIDAFNRRHTGRARVDAIEVKPASREEIAPIAQAFASLEVFFELPHAGDPAQLQRLMAAVREHGGHAKIRTGGVTPELIPSVPQVAEFLAAAHHVGLAFKATAGLHHPIRGRYPLTYEDDSVADEMHGFLNLFLAAGFLYHGQLQGQGVKELLGERSAGAIEMSAAGFSWRGHRLSADELDVTRRRFARSYGSCSFQEPLDDLRALQLI